MFFITVWRDWFLEGLKLFALPAYPSEPLVKVDSKETNLPPGARKSKLPSSGKRSVPKVVSLKLVRAPRGDQALLVREARKNNPRTSSKGRRNGSRK